MNDLFRAILADNRVRARLAMDAGADIRAPDELGRTALHMAVQSRSIDMIEWVLVYDIDIEAVDRFGQTALSIAARTDRVDLVRMILEAGADATRIVRYKRNERPDMCEIFATLGMPVPDVIATAPSWSKTDATIETTALAATESAAVVRVLLDAGADPQFVGFEARRDLIGLPREPTSDALATLTRGEYLESALPRFGVSNPELVTSTFWRAMVRSGVDAFRAREHFGRHRSTARKAVFCARRHGQSITFLPDGRIVQIAGEHEDSYDPDFHIYNDVFVHEPDGAFAIYAYPRDVFPPTDFHTATLVGDTIYLIGALAYPEGSRPGTTPVYALDTKTWAMSRVDVSGEPPGWISRHHAKYDAHANTILLAGGSIVDAAHDYGSWSGSATLDLGARRWR